MSERCNNTTVLNVGMSTYTAVCKLTGEHDEHSDGIFAWSTATEEN